MTRSIIQGEIWKIGEHIIACGDSLDAEFVGTVIGKREIRAILTDPPYGVAYVDGKKGLSKLATDSGIAGDGLQSDEQYARFTQQWLEAAIAHLASYNAAYIFNSDLMYPALREGMSRAGFKYSQGLVWVKNTSVMGRKDYLLQHELIAYGWHGRHKMERTKAKSVVVHPKPARSKLHPTQKPAGLLRKLIPNSVRFGEYVYDPFLGSGSTAVACEHLGRRCIGIELDPGYAGIAIARLEKLTGLAAEKL